MHNSEISSIVCTDNKLALKYGDRIDALIEVPEEVRDKMVKDLKGLMYVESYYAQTFDREYELDKNTTINGTTTIDIANRVVSFNIDRGSPIDNENYYFKFRGQNSIYSFASTLEELEY